MQGDYLNRAVARDHGRNHELRFILSYDYELKDLLNTCEVVDFDKFYDKHGVELRDRLEMSLVDILKKYKISRQELKEFILSCGATPVRKDEKPVLIKNKEQKN